MTILPFLTSLAVALGLGFIIGLERQLTSRSMGIRTGVLVCMGASLFTSFAFCVPSGDVTRMAAQIVSGVGFLGSGIIFKDGFNIRGINTAATIWCTAGIGVMTGAGLYLYAAVAAICLTAANVLMRLLSNRMDFWRFTDDSGGMFRLTLTCAPDGERAVRSKLALLLAGNKTYLLNLGHKRLHDGTVGFEAKFIYDSRDYAEHNEYIVGQLLELASVRDVEWDAFYT